MIKTAYEQWINFKGLEPNLHSKLFEMTESEIEDAFYKDVEFGTGGMRGIVGPGTNRMNLYTIRKANVGFAKYLLDQGEHVKSQGVVIAYDCRHFSPEFAMESAKVLATYGIKAYVFESLRPTPELSFAVRYLKAAGGIVVTASHNPPEYNGYKLYDETGCQLVPHQADQVIKYVDEIMNMFEINVNSEEALKSEGLIEMIGEEVDDAYIEAVKTLEINSDCQKEQLKIVFSPLHGTAYMPVKRVLEECGYTNTVFVEEQCTPDANFSTVKSPNPEDVEAFEMAINLGKQVDADILMATDPDSDRVGLVVKNEAGEYVILTGNQTGAILIHYILSQKKANGTLPTKGKVFNTVVTSDMGAKIARDYGFEVVSTLTGFKFIGEQARLIEDTEYEYVFGYEESYGYLIGDFVRDKDSVQSVLLCAEVAAYYKQQGKTLYNVLLELYEQYGCHREELVNITLKGKEGADKIQAILAGFRQEAPVKVANVSVMKIEDYQTSEALDIETQEVSQIELPKSNVLKYTLADGSWFVLRPSGTEPKAKIYIGVIDQSVESADAKIKQIKDDVLKRINTIIE